MATNTHTDSKAKFETLTYYPHLQTTNDLEAGTPAISVTSKPAAAQYAAALTLAAPSDSRIIINQIGTRLSVTVDSLNAGAAHLYCQVYVDDVTGLVAGNQLFSIDLVATGNALAVQTVLAGTKDAIFNLLKNGLAHTFYFFLWVDAGNAVISLVQLWEGVGNSETSYLNAPVFTLLHSGLVQYTLVALNVVASSGSEIRCFNGIANNSLGGWAYALNTALGNSYSTQMCPCLVVNGGIYFGVRTGSATDMSNLRVVVFVLRNEA